MDTLEKFIMVVDECQDLERELKRVNNQLSNHPIGDHQNQLSTQRGKETMSAQKKKALPHIRVTNPNIGRKDVYKRQEYMSVLLFLLLTSIKSKL